MKPYINPFPLFTELIHSQCAYTLTHPVYAYGRSFIVLLKSEWYDSRGIKPVQHFNTGMR